MSRWITLLGHQMHFLEAGQDSGGPPLVLLHGLAGNSATWTNLLPMLGRRAHVLAPDLFGCGKSAKPPHADYSVGAHATRLRDLLRELRITQASVVGHSFGGGVAMTFAYQFPEYLRHLGLISSGGLGRELTIALRAATLPGVVSAATALQARTPQWLRRLAHRATTAAELAPSSDIDSLGNALRSLLDPHARAAFRHTIRGAVEWSGQRLTATDHLHLLADLPVLLIAGRRDSCIPYQHTLRAHRQLPNSRLVILDSGHYPQEEYPRTVARLITELLMPPPNQSVPNCHLSSRANAAA